jgi:F-type H+-transporting ATPase subunit gamma
MANLKDLRVRISSVKSTQRITSAMKMVAAAKLRRAQQLAQESRPYAERMERMLASVAAGASATAGSPALLVGTGRDDSHLLIVMSSDRGLCGGFNGNIARWTRLRIRDLQGQGKQVKLLIVGRKGFAALRGEYRSIIVDTIEDSAKPAPKYDVAKEIAARVGEMFEAGEFDVCTIFFNRFKSAMSQIVTAQQLIPASIPEAEDDAKAGGGELKALYEYEPDEESILAALLPRNVATQIYTALLENAASEHGARMTAMDSATRNAGDMIDRLTMTYNRTRQAVITKELIEIISGAEAL